MSTEHSALRTPGSLFTQASISTFAPVRPDTHRQSLGRQPGVHHVRRWTMTNEDALDLACWSARDLLTLTTAIRDTHPRDPLRALEDAVLDLVTQA